MIRLAPKFPTVIHICPRCDEPGLHGTTDECCIALRAAIKAERDARGMDISSAAEVLPLKPGKVVRLRSVYWQEKKAGGDRIFTRRWPVYDSISAPSIEVALRIPRDPKRRYWIDTFNQPARIPFSVKKVAVA